MHACMQASLADLSGNPRWSLSDRLYCGHAYLIKALSAAKGLEIALCWTLSVQSWGRCRGEKPRLIGSFLDLSALPVDEGALLLL